MPGRLDLLLGDDNRKPRRLVCCQPHRIPFPSGHHWAHSFHCRTIRKGQKLTPGELAELFERAPHAPPEVGVLSPEEANELRPTGKLALRCWITHPVGCRCFACGYIDSTLDS